MTIKEQTVVRQRTNCHSDRREVHHHEQKKKKTVSATDRTELRCPVSTILTFPFLT